MTIQVFIYAGATEYEFTADMVAVNLHRGRSVELDKIDAGSGTIRCWNHDANFSPFNAGAYGAMAHGRKVVVKDTGVTVFTGFVLDFTFDWEPGVLAAATLQVIDALSTLAGTTYHEHTRTNNQYTGERITDMLDRAEVSFPASPRSIAAGVMRCQGDTVQEGANVLNDLQNIARTEWGRLFVARAGSLTFLDRYAVFGATPTLTFADDGSGDLPFRGIGVTFGSDLLHFSVSVTRAGGVTQTAINAAAIAANPNLGARNLPINGLLFVSDAYSKDLASWLVGRYSEPTPIVSSLRVNLRELDDTDRATVVALDIGAVIALDWTPAGDDPVSQTLSLEGVEYEASADGDQVISFQLSDASAPEFFTLGTSVLGGTDVLGF